MGYFFLYVFNFYRLFPYKTPQWPAAVMIAVNYLQRPAEAKSFVVRVARISTNFIDVK